jgi:molybdate/tungstate transport system substrate-binding protein
MIRCIGDNADGHYTEDLMKGRRLLSISGIVAGGLAWSAGVQAQDGGVLHVALAGTMEQVISRHIGPAFTAATGYALDVTRQSSVALANRIVSGELKPDVYISSDANVMELVMGPANNNRARWYLPILRSRTIIMHGTQSRFNNDIEAVRAGRLPWYELMQRPGLVLKRPNPTIDSGGYRAIFVFDLAERLYKLPGLKERVLGDNHNESQYFDRTKEFPLIRDGSIDVFLTYITNPLVEGFPFLDLPEEIDQSNPSMQNWYETASYTNPRGQTFRGTYAAYAVTIPVAAVSPTAAEAFVGLLLSETGMTMFERAGFYRFKELHVAGDETAMPQSLRSLIKGQCAP